MSAYLNCTELSRIVKKLINSFRFRNCTPQLESEKQPARDQPSASNGNRSEWSPIRFAMITITISSGIVVLLLQLSIFNLWYYKLGQCLKTRLRKIKAINIINVFVACSFLIEGTMLCHTSMFQKFLHLKTFTNSKQPFSHIKLLTRHQTSLGYSKEPLPQPLRFIVTTQVTNLNFHRPRISNNYGATTFAFAGSKIWENIPSIFKKLPCNSFYKHYKTVPFKYIYPTSNLISLPSL